MVNLLEIEKMSFSEYLALKSELHSSRCSGAIDDLWLMTSHVPGVFTLGRNYRESSMIFTTEMIKSSGREIHEIERGGDVTYHGPGQVMVYPFIKVPQKDVVRMVRKLEEVAREFLRKHGLEGVRNPGFPGVWCGGSKIASIGLAVRKWVTCHGMAFNHQEDDGGFGMIIPCGIKGITMTSLVEQTGKAIARQEVIMGFEESIESVFECGLERIGLENLSDRLLRSREGK